MLKNNNMNVLSLFDGLSCGQIALNRAGIKYDNYFASEIKPHAIKVTQHNYPNTIQLGDITKIKAKLLCLSEVYSYICKKYFNYELQNLQGIIPEWEMLHRINEKQSFAAYFGTQKQNEKPEVSKNTDLSINDRIWFFRNEMGSSIGVYDIVRGGERRAQTNKIDVGELCKHSFWWNGNGQSEPGVKEESLNGAYGEKSIGINEREIEKKRYKSICDTGGERSPKAKSIRSISRPCKKNELPECCKENRYSSEVYKKNEYGKSEKRNSIKKVERKLQTDDDNGRAGKNNRNFLFLCEKVQITIVECEWGITIFKGTFKICIGGSPCQDFSQANKERKGLKGEKSSLFFEYVRLLKELKPKYFLLENVSMDDYSYQFISETLGTYPVNINSELVSGQLRQRSYWTNIGSESFDLFGNRYSMIPQPKNKNIMLQDILESGKTDRQKSLCIMARYKTSAPIRAKYEKRYKMGMLQIVYDNEHRLLTTKEIERLQTVPEGYVDNVPGISENMKANLLGDGWTIDVIAHIFSFLPKLD